MRTSCPRPWRHSATLLADVNIFIFFIRSDPGFVDAARKENKTNKPFYPFVFPVYTHAGSAARKKWSLGNYFCVFNPMELKRSNITDIASPNNRMFFVFRF